MSSNSLSEAERIATLPNLRINALDGCRVILEAGFDHGIEVGLAVPAHELLESARFHELEPRDQETVRGITVPEGGTLLQGSQFISR